MTPVAALSARPTLARSANPVVTLKVSGAVPPFAVIPNEKANPSVAPSPADGVAIWIGPPTVIAIRDDVTEAVVAVSVSVIVTL
jgi:hypothetical protein